MRKSALITGGAGFVGRHMARELELRGYDVLTVDPRPLDVPLFPTNRLGHTTFPTTSRLHLEQDMRDYLQRMRTGPLSSRLDDSFDLIVHCAFHVGGRAVIDGRNANFIKNVELDAALFEWATRTQQPHVLYFSSSAVYPIEYQTEDFNQRLAEDAQVPGDERAPNCDANYGWAKYVGELLAQNAIENGVNVTVIRPFSGYGTDQDDTYPFPAFVKRALAREDPFTVWGNAGQVRDWIHIDDVIKGSLAVVQRDADDPTTNYGKTRPVNVGSGEGVALGDLASLICTANGYAPPLAVDETAPMGVFHRVCDPTEFYKIYAPQVDLFEGITRALEGRL